MAINEETEEETAANTHLPLRSSEIPTSQAHAAQLAEKEELNEWNPRLAASSLFPSPPFFATS